MKKNRKVEQPQVARITIDVLVNDVDTLPTDEIVAGLEQTPVLSCCVETLKGNKLKGRLLKNAQEALQMMRENAGIGIEEEVMDDEEEVIC